MILPQLNLAKSFSYFAVEKIPQILVESLINLDWNDRRFQIQTKAANEIQNFLHVTFHSKVFM